MLARDSDNNVNQIDFSPKKPLNSDHVKNAYRRQAAFYDVAFGLVSSNARNRAVQAVNRLPGKRVLEVGVGTGLALPLYNHDKQVVGIDLSTEMLRLARERRAKDRLRHVQSLLEMDAENTTFPDNSFDTAVAMFVASVVPNPQKLFAEMRRVVKPGGNILFVNHFARERGFIAGIERTIAHSSRVIGWHADFKTDALLNAQEQQSACMNKLWPLGLFTLVHVKN